MLTSAMSCLQSSGETTSLLWLLFLIAPNLVVLPLTIDGPPMLNWKDDTCSLCLAANGNAFLENQVMSSGAIVVVSLLELLWGTSRAEWDFVQLFFFVFFSSYIDICTPPHPLPPSNRLYFDFRAVFTISLHYTMALIKCRAKFYWQHMHGCHKVDLVATVTCCCVAYCP